MPDRVIEIDCKLGRTISRSQTPEEFAVKQSDIAAGELITQLQEAAKLRKKDTGDALTQILTLSGANARVRLKAIMAGTDTFKAADRDRVLAAVALALLEDRPDS